MPRRSRFPRTISNFRCCTECAPTCSAGSSRMATAFASTSRSATTGFLTSCGGSPSVPQTSASSSATSSVRKSVSALLLAADGDAVAQRNQHGVKLLRSVDEPVEFLYAASVDVILRCRPRRLPRPQRIVADEQAAAAQLGQRQPQRGRVLVLVHVVEDQIELARRFLQKIMRVANAYLDPFGHARPAKIILRAARFLRIAIRINHLCFRSGRSRKPNRGISDRRAHFKNPLCTGNLHEQRQHSRHRRPDDRNAILRCVILYLPDDVITIRQQLVKIFFDIVLNVAAAQILAANHSFSPGFRAWIFSPLIFFVSLRNSSAVPVRKGNVA